MLLAIVGDSSEIKLMSSKPSIFGTSLVVAVLIGAAGIANSAVGEQASPAAAQAGSSATVVGSSAGSVTPAAVLGVSTGSLSSNSNAMAIGAAAAGSEEALPESNLYMLLVAALAAMGLVVLRRSGGR